MLLIHCLKYKICLKVIVVHVLRGRVKGDHTFITELTHSSSRKYSVMSTFSNVWFSSKERSLADIFGVESTTGAVKDNTSFSSFELFVSLWF